MAVALGPALYGQVITRDTIYAAPYGAYKKITVTRYLDVNAGGTSLKIHSPQVNSGTAHGLTSTGGLSINAQSLNIENTGNSQAVTVPTSVNTFSATGGNVNISGGQSVGITPRSTLSVSGGSDIKLDSGNTSVTGSLSAKRITAGEGTPIYRCSDGTLRLCCTGTQTLYARLVTDPTTSMTTTCWTVTFSSKTVTPPAEDDGCDDPCAVKIGNVCRTLVCTNGSLDKNTCQCVSNEPTCFPAGTMIAVRGGATPIEQIAEGSEILAPTQDGSIAVSHVRQLIRKTGPLFVITTDRGVLKTTLDHPLRRSDGTYTKAGELHTGDRISYLVGITLVDATISMTQELPDPVAVYNLSADEPHTFFADNFAVHNKNECKTCAATAGKYCHCQGGYDRYGCCARWIIDNRDDNGLIHP